VAAKILERTQHSMAALSADLGVVAQERAVQNDRAAVGRRRLEPQLPDQSAQRIGAERFIVVALRHAGLVHHRRGIEPAGPNLAAETVARLEQRRVAGARAFLFQQVRGHQASRPTADDGHSDHASVSAVWRTAPGPSVAGAAFPRTKLCAGEKPLGTTSS
jgi:hypothetical protein